MRSIRRSAAVAMAALALTVLAPVASASPEASPIHMVKDCRTYNGEIPSLCMIALSDLAAIPKGTKVWYQGPILTNTLFLSSHMLLDAGDGDTSTGYCVFEPRTSRGLCSFWEGTGTLAGFNAILDISIDEQHLWHMDGWYYFAEPAPPAPTVGHHQW